MLKAAGCIAGYFDFGVFGLTGAIGLLSGVLLTRSFTRTRSARTRLADAAIEGLIIEQGGCIREVNPALCAMADTRAAALIGRPLKALISGFSLTAFVQPGEFDLIQADGRARAVEVLWRDGPAEGSHILAVRELSAEKAARQQLRRLAQFDPLTGLGNAEMLEHQLLKVLALADRATVGVAVLSVELDGFDRVRDAAGPLASDQIVIDAARRLRRCVRDTDTVARVGPQTFAIIQPLVDKPSDAAVLAERIVADLALPFEDGREAPLNLSASVGVAVYPGGGGSAADMIRNAGRALFRAQQDGAGTWRYVEPEMDVSLRDRRLLEEDLRVALRDGQFTIAWQPIVEMATMRTTGFEASACWDHPARGMVSPAEFMEAAEVSGLTMPLTRAILAAACAEAAGWPRPATLTMGLLPRHFARPGIVEIVTEVLRDTGLPADRLELGIAESALARDAQGAPDILRGLKRLGIRIAMDDFAAGHSGLIYLRRFSFDRIKLGRGFISEFDDANGEAEAVARAIVAMARSLEIDVVADGVETDEQLAVLKTLGCGFVQGPVVPGGTMGEGSVDEPAPIRITAPAG